MVQRGSIVDGSLGDGNICSKSRPRAASSTAACDSRGRNFEEVMENLDRWGRASFLDVRHKGSMVRELKELVNRMVGICVLAQPHPVDRLVVGLVELGKIKGVRLGVLLQPGVTGRNRDKHHGSIVDGSYWCWWVF